MNIIPLDNDSERRPGLNGEKYFLVKCEITLAEIELFLESLTDDQSVSFHDQFYPTHPDDDDGAYVSIERKGEDFKYMYGNHHWSTKWSHQSTKFLAAYILINANSERFDGQPFIIEIYKTFRMTKPPITPNKEERIEERTLLSKIFGFWR